MYGFVVSDSHRAYPTAEPKRPVTTAMEPVESTIDRDLLTEFTRTIPGQLFEARASRTKYEYYVSYGSPMPTLFTFDGLENIGIGPVGTTYGDYRVQYEYDNETMRIEKVSRNALTADGVEYTYRSDAHLIDHYEYMSGTEWLGKVTFAYESDRDLITQVENRWVDDPNDNGVVSEYTYYYDNLGRLETMTRDPGGFGVKSGYIENYTYNDHNMRLTASRYNGTDPNSPGSAAPAYNQTFSYNTYGDRIAEWYGDGNDDPNLAIAFNALNLPIYGYESTDPNDPNYAVKTYTYDDDQNLVADNGMIYRYDAENRLIEAEPNKDPNDMDPNSDFFIKYTYDYLSRVVRERRYEWDSNALDWEATPAVDQRFMYYKRMKLLTLGLDDDEVVPLYKFVYGPGTDGRLGGPGSLLAIRDVSGGSTLDLVCFHNGGGKLVDLAVRDTGDIYENYELVVNRGAYEGGCWSPPWSPSCDACGECFSGWWVDTRIPQPGNPGYSMDVTLPVCHCGDPSDNPGSQRRRKGPDDPCVVAGSPEGCGGCGGGSTLPGWIMVNCYSMPEDEDEETVENPVPPTTQPDECTKCNKNVKAAQNSDAVKSALRYFNGKGQCKGTGKPKNPPTIQCVKTLPGNSEGEYRCDSNNTIYILCSVGAAGDPSDANGMAELEGLIIHELEHAKQCCKNGTLAPNPPKTDKDMQACILQEAQAYMKQCKHVQKTNGFLNLVDCCSDGVKSSCPGADEKKARRACRSYK